jgi:hypothetical protein
MPRELLAFVLGGHADQNIRFSDLVQLLRRVGFAERRRGSHAIFTYEGIPEILTCSHFAAAGQNLIRSDRCVA